MTKSTQKSGKRRTAAVKSSSRKCPRMSLQKFLKQLQTVKRANWELRGFGTVLRGSINGINVCPITAVAAVHGLVYSTLDAHTAARALGLAHDDATQVIRASDSGICDRPELRGQLLRATNMSYPVVIEGMSP